MALAVTLNLELMQKLVVLVLEKSPKLLMKIPYSSFSTTWLRIGLITALATSFSFGLLAQTAPAIQWDKSLGGTNFDELRAIKQTPDGGFIMSGYSDSNISGDKSEASKGSYDFWVVKLDAGKNKVWDKTLGGTGDDRSRILEITSDGGFIIGGYSISNIGGDKSQNSRGLFDYWIVKLDAAGNKQWDKTFGGSDSESLHAIKQTSDGGYILGGFSSSGISGDKSQSSFGFFDYWIIKLDMNGNKVWDKTFGGSGIDQLHSLQQTSDGGFILGGYSNSGISGNKTQVSRGMNDYWVVKTDASGNKLWDKTFGGNDNDQCYSIQQTTDGNYILGGYSLSGINGDKTQASNGSTDFWIIKIDTNGNKLWDKTFGGQDDDQLYALQQTSDGGYILGGTSESNISGDKTQVSKGVVDYWIIKVDANGAKQWDKTIGGNSTDIFSSLYQTLDGGYIIGGYTPTGIDGDKTQNSQGSHDFWIVKLAPEIVGLKELSTTFNLSISPNPNQGKFILQLSNLKVAKGEVTVTDLLGRVVLQKELSVTDQHVSEELTLAVSKGMYVLQVKAGEEVISRKIVME